MAIDISDFDAVVAQVSEYRNLLTVRQALAEGFLRCSTTFSGTAFDLTDQFGQEPIRAALLGPLDGLVKVKRQALIDVGIMVP
jgi:hypothetical protein